jgi:putative ABC transport system permease protein
LASSIVGKPDLSAFLSGEQLVASPATAERLRGETEMMVKIVD